MRRLRALRRWFGRKFGYARLICLVLLIGLAALRVTDPPPVEELRVRVFDNFQRIDPRVKLAQSPVAIVDIDEASLAKLGQWPWPRTRIADMVANLTRLGAVVIGFDVIFAEPDRLNPDVAADTFRDLATDLLEKMPAVKLRLMTGTDLVDGYDSYEHTRDAYPAEPLAEEQAVLEDADGRKRGARARLRLQAVVHGGRQAVHERAGNSGTHELLLELRQEERVGGACRGGAYRDGR